MQRRIPIHYQKFILYLCISIFRWFFRCPFLCNNWISSSIRKKKSTICYLISIRILDNLQTSMFNFLALGRPFMHSSSCCKIFNWNKRKTPKCKLQNGLCNLTTHTIYKLPLSIQWHTYPIFAWIYFLISIVEKVSTKCKRRTSEKSTSFRRTSEKKCATKSSDYKHTASIWEFSTASSLFCSCILSRFTLTLSSSIPFCWMILLRQ